MRIDVKIGEKKYSVDIEDLNARPIVALVDGERIEVTPEVNEYAPTRRETHAAVEAAPKKPGLPADSSSSKTLPAPLPGTVTEVFVKPGDETKNGQVVLVIEAMKMKNNIRTTREGRISAVLVSAGQTVNHKQSLLEYE